MGRGKGPLSFDEQQQPEYRRLILEDVFSGMVETRPVREAAWVRSTFDETSVLANSTNPPSASIALFWIRLHGMLEELVGWASDLEDDLAECRAAEDPRLIAAEALARTTTALRACFTRDELLCIEYHRNLHAHVSLSLYSYAPNRGHQIYSTFTSKLIRTELERKDVKDGIKAVLAAHGGNEVDTAIGVARKAFAQVSELQLAMSRYMDIPWNE